MAKLPAIPSTELAPNCSFAPLSVTLNRLAVPESVDVHTKLAVPAVAANVPVPDTERSDMIEKFLAVVMLPRMFNPLNVSAPAPLMVLAAPVMVMVPAVAENVPVTLKLPPTVSEAAVVIEPGMAR